MAITDDAAKTLEAELQGELIRPGDAGYDEARAIWNGMIDRRPALIARCAGPGDVAAAVRLAAAEGCRSRSGAAATASRVTRSADDGIVVDLSAMREIEVDAERRHGAGAGRRDACRPRRGDAGARAGDAAGRRHQDRDRRADPVRRDRMAAPQARPQYRQPRRRRGGHRRRQRPDRERERERGPVLGAARRWRQLRRRHLPHLPGAPDRPRGLLLLRALPGGARQGGAAGVRAIPGRRRRDDRTAGRAGEGARSRRFPRRRSTGSRTWRCWRCIPATRPRARR